MKIKGFTLVEILIAVSILALLAAIAIPNLLRARHNANESSAIASLRTISTAMESWRATQTPNGYSGASLATLAVPPTGGPPYIDSVLASGAKQGYNFALVLGGGGAPQTYACTAAPQIPGSSGTRVFRVTHTGVIEAQTGGGGWQSIE